MSVIIFVDSIIEINTYMELKTLKRKKKLTDNTIQSVQSYFSNRISKDEIVKLNGNHRSLYYSWYIKWIKHVSSTKQDLWETIHLQKNNLVFINLIFVQFDYLLQNIHPTEKSIEPPTVRLKNYYEYANDVYIEAYGKTLPTKNYQMKELLFIIKECEKVLHEQYINNTQPTHNVLSIRN